MFEKNQTKSKKSNIVREVMIWVMMQVMSEWRKCQQKRTTQ